MTDSPAWYRRRLRSLVTILALVSCPLGASQRAKAYDGRSPSTEERFQDLFVTAGYATAFGAALGTAVLFLNPETDPSTHLRYVAVGASLGFIGGSIMGSYVIFSPMFTAGEGDDAGGLATSGKLPARGIVLRPTIDRDTGRLRAVEGGMTLARF